MVQRNKVPSYHQIKNIFIRLLRAEGWICISLKFSKLLSVQGELIDLVIHAVHKLIYVNAALLFCFLNQIA